MIEAVNTLVTKDITVVARYAKAALRERTKSAI
jgi:hypothetical protein